MIGIVLAIISAAITALSFVEMRKYINQSNTFSISLVTTLVGLLMLWPFAFLFTDFSTVNITGLLLFALSGILAPGFGRLLNYHGIEKFGVQVTNAIISMYPIYSSLLAVLFIGEILFPENWLGIILVLIGGIITNFTVQKPGVKGKQSLFNLVFPLLCGLILGISSIFKKYALNLFNAPILGVTIAYTVSLVLYLIIFSATTCKEVSVKKNLKLFWLSGVGQAIGLVLSYYALSYDSVSVVVPIVATEPLFVALFVHLYLKKMEKVTAKLVVGISLIVIGVVLVTLK